MEKRIIYPVLVTAVGLAGLNIIGYFFPGSLNWGFHFLGFLPPAAFAAYLLLAAVIYFLFRGGQLEKLFERAAYFMEKRPEPFLSSAIFVFILSAFAFRVEASLLGDSYTLIYNFRDYAAGLSYLAPWHEPLSIYVLYYFVSFLGSLDYPQIFTSFFIAGVLFGVLFIIVTFFIVKNLFSSSVQRLMTFLFLMALPYMELFFGYVEVYSVSTFLLALFTLCSVLVLKKNISFFIVPAVWVLLALSHYINLLLAPALLYLAYIEYRQKNFRSLAAGFGAGLFLILLVLFAAHFEMDRIINISPVSHFLSLGYNISPVNAYSQPYTIFSVYHLVDILNYIIMMSPFAVLIIVMWSVYDKDKKTAKTPVNLWLIISIAPLFSYYLISKLEQGNASDWDAFAGQFFLVAIFSAGLFFQNESRYNSKVFSLIVSVSLLHSLPWFALNGSAEPSIRRFQSLWDKRNLSHLGNYTHALRLYRHYDSKRDSLRQIDVWDKYSNLYPDDPRGYINTMEVLNKFTPKDYGRKITVLERWMIADPENDSLRIAHTAACVNGGNERFIAGNLEEAKLFYYNAIIVDSTASRAFNNLGSVYARQGKLDTAIILYERAIRIDTTYAEAFYNIGTAFIDRGRETEGDGHIRRAARLGNPQAEEFLQKRR